jgi:hypothetical protein
LGTGGQLGKHLLPPPPPPLSLAKRSSFTAQDVDTEKETSFQDIKAKKGMIELDRLRGRTFGFFRGRELSQLVTKCSGMRRL